VRGTGSEGCLRQPSNRGGGSSDGCDSGEEVTDQIMERKQASERHSPVGKGGGIIPGGHD